MIIIQNKYMFKLMEKVYMPRSGYLLTTAYNETICMLPVLNNIMLLYKEKHNYRRILPLMPYSELSTFILNSRWINNDLNIPTSIILDKVREGPSLFGNYIYPIKSIKPIDGIDSILWPFIQDIDIENDLPHPMYPLDIDLIYKHLTPGQSIWIYKDGAIHKYGTSTSIIHILDTGMSYLRLDI